MCKRQTVPERTITNTGSQPTTTLKPDAALNIKQTSVNKSGCNKDRKIK